MTETTEELVIEPYQKQGLSIMHIKLNEVVMKKLASGVASASIVFNGGKAVSTFVANCCRLNLIKLQIYFVFLFSGSKFASNHCISNYTFHSIPPRSPSTTTNHYF
jgi:hypothetical protein